MKNKRNPLRKAKTSKNKIKYNKFKYNLQKYNTHPIEYNIYIINSIIFNINIRIVSNFKDYLILDDPNDFFRRFYSIKESVIHLKYYISFYEENNRIFPNYFSLPESKYLYRNIQQKQNILNNIENQNLELNKRRQSYTTIFSSTIKQSIYNESEYPSNSIISNGEEEIKQLINNINKYNPSVSYIKKGVKYLMNDESIKKLNKKELMENKVGKFTLNKNKNNISSNNKISLLSTEREHNLDEIEKEEEHDVNFYMSDRINNINDKEMKHKRIMTNDNKELKKVCKYAKISKEKGKTNKKLETKERIKKLIKTMKLLFKNENKKNNKTIIIKDIDNTNNNDNTKIAYTSRNLDKKTKTNSKIFKSVINPNYQIIKNDKKINKKEKIKKSKSKQLNSEKDNNIFHRVIPHKLSSKRKDYKPNEKYLHHINKNSNSNFNILTETSKLNLCYNIVSNNNSLSFNSPFIQKKIENKLKSTESFPRFKISTQKKLKRKLLIKNCLNGNKKAISEFCYKDNKNNKSNNFNINDLSKNYIKDFSTQINFRNSNSKQEIKNYKYIKKDYITPKTSEKNKYKQIEKLFSLLKNNNKNKNSNNKKNSNNNCQKKTKYALKTRNSSAFNTFNINFSNINHLKILNNLYTTINIYDLSKNKNKSRNNLKTESINSKIISETYFNDTNKINKNLNIITDYKCKSKKKLSNNNNKKIIKKYIDITHSNKSNITDLVSIINKTTNNFNSLLNKKNTLHYSTSNYFKRNKKLKKHNLRPSLIKKLNKEILLPQNSSRISTLYNKETSKSKNEDIGNIFFNNIIKEIRLNDTSTTRKLSTDDKKMKTVTAYSISEQNNKKKQKKIKLNNFKQIIYNINSERKEIDRKKINALANDKKSLRKKRSSGLILY